MAGDALCWMGLPELRAGLRARQFSAEELARAVLERVAASQPHLNAFVTITEDIALREARAADAALAAGQDARGVPIDRLPLLGIPYSVKDLTHTAGVPTRFGSVTHADFVPQDDAVPVARLKDAGAVLVGKTTTPAFGHKPITEGKAFGVTRNPWNTAHTPGGSSGGAGAAIAAGLGPIGLGTDGGGSVRIPAACCGIVGLKQTLGTIPHIHGPDLFGNHSFIGPMARTVADCRALFLAIAGGHPMDAHALRVPAPGALPIPPPLELKGLRLGWMPRVGNPKVHPEVAAHTGAIVEALAAEGAVVEEIAPDFATLMEPFNIIFMSAMHARLGHLVEAHREGMDSTLLRSIEMGGGFSASQLQGALMRRSELFRQVQALFGEYDFLISPTLSRPALRTGHDLFEPIEIGGEPVGLTRTAWYPYTLPFNLTGHPAITIPAGLTSANDEAGGLPTAFQIVGPWDSDLRIFDLAEAIEHMRPWAHQHPPLPLAD